MITLFRRGRFDLHSGQRTWFKIDCDALTDEDLSCLAEMAASVLPEFGTVVGIPQGGDRFARALKHYRTKGPVLLVDDVLTSGKSMRNSKEAYPDAIGVVIFARGPCPDWVIPLFTLSTGVV